MCVHSIPDSIMFYAIKDPTDISIQHINFFFSPNYTVICQILMGKEKYKY